MCYLTILSLLLALHVSVADYALHVKKSFVENFGQVYTVYETSDDACNDKLYIEYSPDDALNLTCDGPMCMYCPIMLPDAARHETPFDHVCLFYQTMGHPPYDGHGGGFGTPHLDFHFNTVTFDELSTYTCGGHLPCDAADPANKRFFDLPPPENYPSEFYESPTFGSHAIELMGNHLIRIADDRYFTAYDIDLLYSINLTSPTTTSLIEQLNVDVRPLWKDCDLQMLQHIAGIEPVLDSGCRIPVWWPPVSPIYATYNQTLVAAELMTPLSALEESCYFVNNSMTQPELEWAWASYFSTYGPVGYFMERTDDHSRIGFELNNAGTNQQCKSRRITQSSEHTMHQSMITTSRNTFFPLIFISLLVTSLCGIMLTAQWICTNTTQYKHLFIYRRS